MTPSSGSAPSGSAWRALRTPPLPAADETIPPPGTTPIYSALRQQWAAARRTVPGRVDPEWAALVDYAAWREASAGCGRHAPPDPRREGGSGRSGPGAFPLA
ncbi:hypothetical protein GCM10023347_29630 [Streptomyces chumphonensis]